MKCLYCDSERSEARCSHCAKTFCDTCALKAENKLLNSILCCNCSNIEEDGRPPDYCNACESGSMFTNKLKAERDSLRNALIIFDDLMSHADFKNGIESQGTDQGEHMAHELYSEKLEAIVNKARAKLKEKSKQASESQKPVKRVKWTRKRKNAQQQAISHADSLLQAAVLKRDKGMCQYPGCKLKAAEGHHIIHKSSKLHPLRWKLYNVISLCRMHHSWDSIGKLKSKLLAACIKWLGGQHRYDALRLEGNTSVPETAEQAIERLTSKI